MVRSGAVKTILRLFAVLLTALLALALVRQTAFAKTYVITDGDRVVTYTTFATDPAEVLDQAGLTLEQYDTYTTQTGEGVEEITICRSQRVTVDYHGEEMTVTTFGETAGELLSRLKGVYAHPLVVAGKAYEGDNTSITLTMEELERMEEDPAEVFRSFCREELGQEATEHFVELFRKAVAETEETV